MRGSTGTPSAGTKAGTVTNCLAALCTRGWEATVDGTSSQYGSRQAPLNIGKAGRSESAHQRIQPLWIDSGQVTRCTLPYFDTVYCLACYRLSGLGMLLMSAAL